MKHQTKTRTSILICLSVLLTVAAVLTFTSCKYYTSATTAPPDEVDAVVVLAGSAAERWPTALQLVNEGMAPTLVVSVVDKKERFRPASDCHIEGLLRAKALCFGPSPVNTRGEAVGIGHIARQNGWKSIVVVTSSYHVARARLLVSQCTTASVYTVASKPKLDVIGWSRMFLEEGIGLLDARLRPECRDGATSLSGKPYASYPAMSLLVLHAR